MIGSDPIYQAEVNVFFTQEKNPNKNICCMEFQGFVLGPLLFIIYINDICNSMLYNKTSLFADDTSLLYSDFSLKKN